MNINDINEIEILKINCTKEFEILITQLCQSLRQYLHTTNTICCLCKTKCSQIILCEGKCNRYYF